MLSLGFLAAHQCPALSPTISAAWLGHGAWAHSWALWSSTSHCTLHHLQILFKDLFRFLLVYLLFMIGYASGRRLAGKLGLRGRTSPAARHGMARHERAEVCRAPAPSYPSAGSAFASSCGGEGLGQRGAVWGPVVNPILAAASTDSPSLSLLPQLWCPSSTRVPAVIPVARSSPTARCPPTPPAGTARPSAPSCSTSLSSPLAWATWRCLRVPSTLVSSSSSLSPTSSSPLCSSSTCSSLSWVRLWARSPRRASTSGSCRYHPRAACAREGQQHRSTPSSIKAAPPGQGTPMPAFPSG